MTTQTNVFTKTLLFAAASACLTVFCQGSPALSDFSPVPPAHAAQEDWAKDRSIPIADPAKRELAHKIMNDHYGSFDRTRNAWVARLNGKIYRMNIRRIDSFKHEGQPTFQLYASGNADDAGRVEGGLVSAFIVVPDGAGGYRTIAKITNYEMGHYGYAPDKAIRMSVGNGIMAWQIQTGDLHMGYESLSEALLVPFNGRIIPSEYGTFFSDQNVVEKNATRLSATFGFDKKVSGKYWTMKFTVKGTAKGKKAKPKTVSVPFNYSTGKYNPPGLEDVIKGR